MRSRGTGLLHDWVEWGWRVFRKEVLTLGTCITPASANQCALRNAALAQQPVVPRLEARHLWPTQSELSWGKFFNQPSRWPLHTLQLWETCLMERAEGQGPSRMSYIQERDPPLVPGQYKPPWNLENTHTYTPPPWAGYLKELAFYSLYIYIYLNYRIVT